jgi:hypothetical protein
MPNTDPGARALRAPNSHAHGEGRTPAQWYCLLGGLALLLAGALGFLADASFDTGSTPDVDRLGNANGQLQGDSFLGFEVNGWHNVIHIATGLFLLLGASRARRARTFALIFGVLYGIVTIVGLIDGNDVLGLFPINAADNVLHIGLTALAFVAAAASPNRDTDGDLARRPVVETQEPQAVRRRSHV